MYLLLLKTKFTHKCPLYIHICKSYVREQGSNVRKNIVLSLYSELEMENIIYNVKFYTRDVSNSSFSDFPVRCVHWSRKGLLSSPVFGGFFIFRILFRFFLR
jgi:hypothetical protein